MDTLPVVSASVGLASADFVCFFAIVMLLYVPRVYPILHLSSHMEFRKIVTVGVSVLP